MNVVADASVLIAELMRVRGRAFLASRKLRVLFTEEQWAETERGLDQRATVLRRRLATDEVEGLLDEAYRFASSDVLGIAPRATYEDWEPVARRRIRDPNDWPTLALALAIDAPVLTSDPDFFGCGIATWKVESLLAELPYIEEHEGR